MTVFGLDVSRYQAGLNIAGAKKQGYQFLIAKCTEGQGYVSPTYVAQRSAAKDAGMLFAAYHFLRSDSDPVSQARNIRRNIGDRAIPVAIDCEVSGASRPNMTHVIMFTRACQNAGLKVTMLYLPKFWWDSIGRPAIPQSYAFWQALYGTNPAGHGSSIYPGDHSPRWNPVGGHAVDILQFGSRGHADGFGGALDVNAYRGSMDELAGEQWFIDYRPARPAPTPAPTPAPNPVPKPQPGRKETTFRVSTLTLSRMKLRKAEADIHAATKNAGIVCWQGITTRGVKDALAHLDSNSWATYFPGGVGECPITWRSAVWELVHSGFKRTHGRRRGVTSARQVSWVVLRNRRTGLLVPVVNTHTLSGAWRGAATFKRWRRQRWNDHLTVLRDVVQGFAGRGYPVVVAGNLHRPHVPPLLSTLRWVENTGNASYIGVDDGRNGEFAIVNARVDDSLNSAFVQFIVRLNLIVKGG